MDHHSRRFVDDKQIVVFVNNAKRDVFGRRLGRDGRRNRDRDFVGLARFLSGLDGDDAVYRDKSRLDQPLDPRPREVRIFRQYRFVQPHLTKKRRSTEKCGGVLLVNSAPGLEPRNKNLRVLGNLHDALEAFRIADGDLGEHLAVERHASLDKPGHEL